MLQLQEKTLIILTYSVLSCSWIFRFPVFPCFLTLRHGWKTTSSSFLLRVPPSAFHWLPLIDLLRLRLQCPLKLSLSIDFNGLQTRPLMSILVILSLFSILWGRTVTFLNVLTYCCNFPSKLERDNEVTMCFVCLGYIKRT